MARRPSSLGRRWSCYRPALSGCGTQSGGSTFTPLSLPGLVSWHKADQSGSLWQDSARTTPATADADPVGAWDDLSPNGNHLIQATASKRPQLKLTGGATGVGGRRLLFDGADDFLSRAGLNLGAAHMICLLLTVPSAADYIFTGKAAGNGAIIGGFAGDFEYYGSSPRVVIAATGTAPAGFNAVSAGGSATGVVTRLNGAASATSATAAPDLDGGVTLGAVDSGTDSYIGSISEVLLFNVYSAATLAAVDAYLNARR